MDLHLRKMNESDLEFLLEVRNHDSTRVNLENDSVFNLDECKKWFQKLDSPWFIMIVDNEKVGYLRTNGDEIGADVHPNHRRKGYARLAYTQYLDKVSKASLWVFENNFAKDLYEELGFKATGEVKVIRKRNYIEMTFEK